MSTTAPAGVSGIAAPDPIDLITANLAGRGWCAVPRFLTGKEARALGREARGLWREGEFRQAGVGRGTETRVVESVRSDHVRWLDQERLTAAQRVYFDKLEALQTALNRRLFLGLFSFEGHLAMYPPGGYYQPHLDRHRDCASRVVTASLYLNEHWRKEDGGQLRLFTDSEAGVKGPFKEIYPRLGTLVVFLSGEFWHGVQPALRERLSLTGWFRVREEGALPPVG